MTKLRTTTSRRFHTLRALAIALSMLPGAALAGTATPRAPGEARFERFTYEGMSPDNAAAAKGQYRNPILAGYYPDPSITRVGDDYYLVNSSFSHFPGIPVFHSRDLVNWTQIGNAIDRPGQLDFTGRTVSQGVFAPDISYHDGVFYIVNTCVGCKGNFVITAKNPAGPWSDPIWLDFEGIDPAIYWEGDKAYIVNNRAPNETPRYSGHRAIWVQEFDWRAGKMVGESTQIVNGGVDISQKPSWIEGPHLFKRDGFYYLIAAEGGTADNHSEVVFRSTSLRGPFVPYDHNPILTQRGLDPARANPVTSAGHADFVQTPDGAWWATFLATRPYGNGLYNIGRETFLLPVTWHDGWPQILPPNMPVPHVAKRPALPAQPAPALPTTGALRYADEFSGRHLDMRWIGIRTPKQPVYRLDKGALILGRGAALGDQNGVPAFVGRRQQHHDATISTTLRYTPVKDGDRAGLAAVQSDQSYLFFGLTRLGGRPTMALFTRDKTPAEALIASAPLVSGAKKPGNRAQAPVTLTITAHGGTMSFAYTVGRQRHMLAKNVDVTLLSTGHAGGFVGTVVGPYAWAQ